MATQLTQTTEDNTALKEEIEVAHLDVSYKAATSNLNGKALFGRWLKMQSLRHPFPNALEHSIHNKTNEDNNPFVMLNSLDIMVWTIGSIMAYEISISADLLFLMNSFILGAIASLFVIFIVLMSPLRNIMPKFPFGPLAGSVYLFKWGMALGKQAQEILHYHSLSEEEIVSFLLKGRRTQVEQAACKTMQQLVAKIEYIAGEKQKARQALESLQNVQGMPAYLQDHLPGQIEKAEAVIAAFSERIKSLDSQLRQIEGEQKTILNEFLSLEAYCDSLASLERVRRAARIDLGDRTTAYTKLSKVLQDAEVFQKSVLARAGAKAEVGSNPFWRRN